MEITNEAIEKLIEKTQGEYNIIRIGVTGGGCAGYEYIILYLELMNHLKSLIQKKLHHVDVAFQ
jgi:Fe-S cluster assembly iron-binding protein IscA